MFVRVNYKKDSIVYNDYYKKNFDKKEIDDSIRNRLNLCSEGIMIYNELNFLMVSSVFDFLFDIKFLCEGKVFDIKVDVDVKLMIKKIKGFVKQYGVFVVGIIKLKDYYIYINRGRYEENYGEEINLIYKYVIVFGCEMDKEMINRVLMICEVIEILKCYVDVFIVGMILSYYIRNLGYDVRNYMDVNYLVMFVFIVCDVGLGDIGRNVIFMNKDYGFRFRLGVVIIDIFFLEDEYVDFGLEDFCKVCKKCFFNCFFYLFFNDIKIGDDGKYNWVIEYEICYIKWRYLGIDCGMCIFVCLFS